VNWNNKPAPWWPNFDRPTWGEIFRIHRIDKLVNAHPRLGFEQVRAILADIGTNDPTADYLKPYLLQAAAPLAETSNTARRILETLAVWDNHAEDDSIPKAFFDNWIRGLREAIWRAELGDVLSGSQFERLLQPSAILHVVAGKDSGVPLQYDFLRRIPPDKVMADAAVRVYQAMLKKEPDVTRWGYRQPMINFQPLPGIPSTNRGTYIQIVETARDKFRAVSILPPGQSEDPASPHYSDQREMAGYWRFKPMLFTREELGLVTASGSRQ